MDSIQQTAISDNKAAHTPGPWKWFDYPDGRKLLAAPARAVIHCPDAPMAVEPADQSLIAAAPLLLAAVKGLLSDIDTGVLVRDITRDDDPTWSREMLAFVQRLHQAQAAVLAAEGR